MEIDEAIRRHLRQGQLRDQECLRQLLETEGLSLTVPTLSRRLRRLGVRKIQGVYRLPEASPDAPVQSLRKVAPCLLILKTKAGVAQALAVAMDQAGLPHLGGSVSGYDTIFIAPTEAQHLDTLEAEVRRYLGE